MKPKIINGILLVSLVALGLMHWFPAQATHVTEPTAPVTDLDLFLESYGTGITVDCTGVTPFPFERIRVAMFVDSTATPSEHFTGKYRLFKRIVQPNGVIRWQGTEGPSWGHQNIPPHSPPNAFDAAKYSDIGRLTDGWWRVEAKIIADESGTVLVDSCEFQVDVP